MIAGAQLPAASWIIVTVAGGLASLAGLWVLFAAPEGEDFTLGLYAAGFSLLSVIVALTAFRAGQTWAWAAMWLPAAVYGITAAGMLVGRSSVGYTYLAYAVLTVVGLLIPIRRVLG
jgi:hypothetical protein